MAKHIPWHEKHKVDLPEGQIGNWKVEHFTVGAADEASGRLHAAISSSSMGRFVPAGRYTALKRGGAMWMSDTPDEIRDHIEPIIQTERAGGHILINGLGLGMVAAAALKLRNVKKVTVIEISPEVIELVGPTLKERYGDKLDIIEADAYTYQPPKGVRYNVVWHDIWLDLCTDNLKEMAKLHRKYGRRTDWQGSWGKESLKSQQRYEKARGW